MAGQVARLCSPGLALPKDKVSEGVGQGVGPHPVESGDKIRQWRAQAHYSWLWWNKNDPTSPAWWLIPVISGLGRLGQEDWDRRCMVCSEAHRTQGLPSRAGQPFFGSVFEAYALTLCSSALMFTFSSHDQVGLKMATSFSQSLLLYSFFMRPLHQDLCVAGFGKHWMQQPS